MALEELRKKVLYQNSIEIWIGISKEKNIDWVDTDNYQKFIAFLLKNNQNMKKCLFALMNQTKHLRVVTAKKYLLIIWQQFNDENSACYSIKLNDGAILN